MEAKGQGRAPELLIASDLVNALMQVENFHPASTRLQMQDPKHRFGKTLNKVLLAAGYEIQRVDARIGDRFVDYEYSNRKHSQSDSAQTYQINVGPVGIKRDYALLHGEVQPSSDLYVSGVDSSGIKLNDQIFSDLTPAQQENATSTIRQPSTVKERPTNPRVDSPTPMTPVPDTSPLQLLVNGNEQSEKILAGEKLVFTLRTTVDARLACYYQGPDKNIIRIYPNRFSAESTLAAGEKISIPSSDNWFIEATKAGFSDEVMCVSVHPTLDSPMSEFESTPDFEPLPATSFDELLTELASTTGVMPKSKQLTIPVR